MPIKITAKRDGFRRCGIAHSEITQTYADDHFSASDLKILENEPQLIVVKVGDVPDISEGNGEALLLAQNRIAELEAGINQLSTDAETLKTNSDNALTEANSKLNALQLELDTANKTIADQVTEIAALKAQVTSLTPAKK